MRIQGEIITASITTMVKETPGRGEKVWAQEYLIGSTTYCCVAYLWGSKACFLKQSKIMYHSTSCETISKITECCETELMWLTVWKENDCGTNSHLIAGKKSGHSRSYPCVSLGLSLQFLWPINLFGRATSQQAWPQSLAESSGNHTERLIHYSLTTQLSTTRWLITFIDGSVTHLNQDTSDV